MKQLNSTLILNTAKHLLKYETLNSEFLILKNKKFTLFGRNTI